MQKQRGMSFFGVIFLIAIIGSLVSLGIKIIPPYIDFLTVKSATLETITHPRMGLQTNETILKKIDTQLSINNIKLKELEEGVDPITVSREEGLLVAEIDYTVVKPVFTSEEVAISVNLHFVKTLEADLDGE